MDRLVSRLEARISEGELSLEANASETREALRSEFASIEARIGEGLAQAHETAHDLARDTQRASETLAALVADAIGARTTALLKTEDRVGAFEARIGEGLAQAHETTRDLARDTQRASETLAALVADAAGAQTTALLKTEDRLGALLAQNEARLRANATVQDTANESRLMQLSAFIERRISNLADDRALAERTLAEAIETGLARLNEQVSGLSGVHARADAAEARALENAAALRKANAEAEARAGEHRAALAAANARIDEITRDKAEGERVVQARVEREIAALKAELAADRQRQQESQAIASAAQAEIDALRQSASWRLTAPLRALINPRAARDDLRRWRDRRRMRAYTRLVGARFAASAAASPREHDHYAGQIARSSLFDPDWYLEAHPDLKGAGVDPLHHYLYHGGARGAGQVPDSTAAGIWRSTQMSQPRT